MKKLILIQVFLLSLCIQVYSKEWIRINQLGYMPHLKKIAVVLKDDSDTFQDCYLVDAFTNKKVYSFNKIQATGPMGNMKQTFRIDFSEFNKEGSFYIQTEKGTSPIFPINNEVYKGTADQLLIYMRQQRCGYNPLVQDSCHTHDGYIIYHPTKNGQYINVKGGWHDAGDYLQYTTTSANAIYQMMFAYSANPTAFKDNYGDNGVQEPNGIPDIIDEIKWGLDWLNKMNPNPGELYNQIADDRDHIAMSLPNNDTINYGYGKGLGRPVYFCSGEKQIRGQFENATQGVASTAGKFASCFALGSQILAPFYPDFATEIGCKAEAAYQEGINKPGVCQTASVRSPYIYEEINWVDDMELGAIELYKRTNNTKFLNQAIEFGRQEPITPWMGADSAKHYQWYPFMNMGHYWLAKHKDNKVSNEFIRNMKSGIQRTYEKAQTNPFLNGIPHIWCSNNLTVAMLTQCHLYRELSGDTTYEEMEASLRDWLFGCNPWGSSMLVEVPLYGIYPQHPHSPFIIYTSQNTTGGLVDGPVYTNIFNNLRGVHLKDGEDYKYFQPKDIVFHDDFQDYSTNEPTMDGTASFAYYLSAMEREGQEKNKYVNSDKNQYIDGGIVRTDPSKKNIALVFTSDQYIDGYKQIIQTLKKHNIKSSFFFTGNFVEKYPQIVKDISSEGHYIGTHGDKHLLYCSWENRDSLLLKKEEFHQDIINGCKKLIELNIKPSPLFIPSYEYYNKHISSWTKQLGMQIVNFTPHSFSNADYTTPDMNNYKNSKKIYESIIQLEKRDNLNGAILLVHFGTHPDRIDKFYSQYLNKLIEYLHRNNYNITPVEESIL